MTIYDHFSTWSILYTFLIGYNFFFRPPLKHDPKSSFYNEPCYKEVSLYHKNRHSNHYSVGNRNYLQWRKSIWNKNIFLLHHRSYSKRKEFAPKGSKFFLLRVAPILEIKQGIIFFFFLRIFLGVCKNNSILAMPLTSSIWATMSENILLDMCLAKIQISLRILADWPESSLGTFRIDKAAKFLHADNKGSK